MDKHSNFADAFVAGVFCDEDDFGEIRDFGILGTAALALVKNLSQPLGARNEFSAASTHSQCLGSLLVADNYRHDHPAQSGFMEVLEDMPEEEFFKHLRVTRPSFENILRKIIEIYGDSPPGRTLPHGPKFALCVTLCYLGNQTPYREISQLFGVVESTVHLCTQRVLDVLVSAQAKYIVWPSGDKLQSVEEEFKSLAGFGGVIGAIDGYHIKIKAPSFKQEDYLNRKFEHSVNLMAIASADLKFNFINAGFPGSALDSHVLQNSTLWKDVMNGLSDKYFPFNNYHILGDSAFPLHKHLLVPYKSTETLKPHQEKYNNIHTKTRIVIEKTFGFLKGRFKRLKFIDADIERMTSIIIGCCVLHNMTIDCVLERQFLENEGLEADAFPEDLVMQSETAEDDKKREAIALDM